jgi:S-adenosylmethionine-diacylglycerol 3-amino-3-carboxypropyl transferase
MALPHLQRLFSPQATQNALVPFARHFASRTRRAIIGLPAASNPYLWQMLLGRFPDGVVYPWLAAQSPAQMPKITESVSTADAALATFKDRLDFVHLSNILDWLSADEARRTLSLAGQALRPGGYVLIRQLNSSLDLRGVGDQFEWLEDESDRLHAEDRSFFYRQLHLGRRR